MSPSSSANLTSQADRPDAPGASGTSATAAQLVPLLHRVPLAEGLLLPQLCQEAIDEDTIGPVEPKAAAALAVLNDGYRASLLEAPPAFAGETMAPAQTIDRIAQHLVQHQAELAVYLDALGSPWPAPDDAKVDTATQKLAQQRLSETQSAFAASLVAWTETAPTFAQAAYEALVDDIQAVVGTAEDAPVDLEAGLQRLVDGEVAAYLQHLVLTASKGATAHPAAPRVQQALDACDLRLGQVGAQVGPRDLPDAEAELLPQLGPWLQRAQKLTFVTAHQMLQWPALFQMLRGSSDVQARWRAEAFVPASEAMAAWRDRSQALSRSLLLEHYRLSRMPSLAQTARAQLMDGWKKAQQVAPGGEGASSTSDEASRPPPIDQQASSGSLLDASSSGGRDSEDTSGRCSPAPYKSGDVPEAAA